MIIDVNQNIYDNMPPDNRTEKHIAWMEVLMSAYKWLVDLYQDDYIAGGNAYDPYDAGTTYVIGDRVIYEFAIYESLQDSNTGNAVSDTAYWLKVQNDYVGVDERRYYNSSKLILEYALNKRFGGTFAQPPSTSDIYITKNAIQVASFVSFATEESTSASFRTYSNQYSYNDTYFGLEYAFTINFPAAVLAAVTGGEEGVRQFVDRYNIYGTAYEIDTY